MEEEEYFGKGRSGFDHEIDPVVGIFAHEVMVISTITQEEYSYNPDEIYIWEVAHVTTQGVIVPDHSFPL